MQSRPTAITRPWTWVRPISGKRRQWASKTSAPTTGKVKKVVSGLSMALQKMTDPQYVAVFDQLAKWGALSGQRFEAQSYPDSQNLFTLGQAPYIRPVPGTFRSSMTRATSRLGAFPPPLPEGADTCYISDHTDIAIGINSKSAHPDEAKIFLEWMTSDEFADVIQQCPARFLLPIQPQRNP